MQIFKSAIVCCLLVHGITGAAIPIWELLAHEEKMGRLFYIFVHLVDQYCKTSDIPDCQKVLTLYGISNLVSEDEHNLDLLDPYQRDAKVKIWERIMRGEFKLPAKVASPTLVKTQSISNSNKKETEKDNEVYARPYEVRVRPPANFAANLATSTSSGTRVARSLTLLDRLSLPEGELEQLLRNVQ